MGKTAFIFPGQGSQYVGMGRDFYKKYNVSKRIFTMASEVTGLDICKLCFEENNDINITEYTQICVLTTEVAIIEAMAEEGIIPDITAGLSLGEYASVIVSGAISKENVFNLVRQRGIYMQEACPTGGAMMAIIGLDAKIIESIVTSINGIVSIANYNCPEQIVITGEEMAVKNASDECIKAGAKRAIKLNVSGPFHSVLLDGASIKLADDLEKVEINDIRVQYLANVTAEYARTDIIKELLIKQITSPVKWQQSVEKMIEDGVDKFIEVGPGKTLSGFIKKIDKEVNIKCVNSVDILKTNQQF